MRYFELNTQWGRPHVLQEIATIEEAKRQLDRSEVFTDRQMMAHPVLRDALERWDRGDRSLFAHDAAHYLLACLAVWDLTNATSVGEAYAQLFVEYAATDPLCKAVAMFWAELFTDLRTRIVALGVTEHPRDLIRLWDESIVGELRPLESV